MRAGKYRCACSMSIQAQSLCCIKCLAGTTVLFFLRDIPLTLVHEGPISTEKYESAPRSVCNCMCHLQKCLCTSAGTVLSLSLPGGIWHPWELILHEFSSEPVCTFMWWVVLCKCGCPLESPGVRDLQSPFVIARGAHPELIGARKTALNTSLGLKHALTVGWLGCELKPSP